MSLYRLELRDGVLVRAKRSMIRAWNWSFNRSLEDELIIARNMLNLHNQQVRLLRDRVPRLEAKLKRMKDKVAENGGKSQPFADKWSRRKEPVPEIRPTDAPKRTEKKKKPAPPPHTVAKLVVDGKP